MAKNKQEKNSRQYSPFSGTEEGQLTVDVHQNENEFIIKSAVAGVKSEDIDIQVTDDMVTIRGTRHRDEELHPDGFLYQECFWGAFSRSVILPGKIDPSRVSAAIKNGILTVRLPKVTGQRVKKIDIQ